MKRFHVKPVLRILLASTLLLSTTGCNELIGFLSPIFSDQNTPVETGSDPVLTKPQVKLEKGADHSGEVDTTADMEVVSAEYWVQLQNPEAGDTAAIQIPLSQIPSDLANAQLQPERYDAAQGAWMSSGQLAWYDSGSQSVWFRDQLPVTVTPASDFATEEVSSQAVKYRIRIYLFSNLQTAFREGSHFRIHYYPSNLANKSKVKTDVEWDSPNGSDADNVPDFIEDLDRALNAAYDGLLQVSNSQGKVFKALDTQDVYVCDTGTSAGDSKLGGPLRISNSKITSYEDMKLTAAHELVHVFQGQYYTLSGLFTGRYNHWFIEAVANVYAARVNHLDDAGKKAFYGDFYSDYLSVPLTSNLDNSMYAAGHFLDWLSQEYNANVVGDALRLSSGNDMVGLSKAISLASNGASSIGSAFEDYLTAILTQPEGTAGFNLAIRNAMAQYSFGNGQLSSIMLNDSRTYARMKKTLPPLTAGFVSLNLARVQNPADRVANLLVIANNGNQGSLLNGKTYLMEGDHNSDYENVRPIDRYLNHESFSELHEFLSFETLSQMLYNSSPASSAKVDLSYYVLKKPQYGTSSGNNVVFNLKNTFGNIPRDYLLGFKIYDYNGNLIKGPVAVQAKGDLQTVALPTSSLTYHTVVDKFGNEWPYQIILGSDNAKGFLDPGETAHITAHTIGFEDNDLQWKIERSATWGETGSFSAGGKQASFTMDSNTGAVNISVTSKKYPMISADIEMTDAVGGCVAAGTLVTLADGSRKAIELLQAGDLIEAWDEDRQQVVQAHVRRLLIHHDATYTLNRLEGADGDEIQITGNHPVYTLEAGWIPVDQLRAGMTIYQLDHLSHGFLPTVVKGIVRAESTTAVVYNILTSEGNYFANDLLIHNKCLAQGSTIDTPWGAMAVEDLIPGMQVYAGDGSLTTVRKVYRKETVLPSLPGKILPHGVRVTGNHRIFWRGQWQKAAETNLPDTAIAGAVYDLETTEGTYRSGPVVMGIRH